MQVEAESQPEVEEKKPILITGIKRFSDHRGSFSEVYKKSYLASFGILTDFVQDNQSISRRNTIRGLHYQWNLPMDKLVRVSKGEIMDVVVNIKSSSPDFGRVHTFYLSEENLHQLFIPSCYAHGFVALSDEAIVHYKCSNEYNKEGEGGICPLDKTIGIDWGVSSSNMIISDKDRAAQSFQEYKDNPKF